MLLQIRTMASGPSPTGMKFFLYAKTQTQAADDLLLMGGSGGGGGQENGDLFLVQLEMESSSGNMTITLKASNTDSQLVAQLLATVKQGLACFSPN